MMQVGISTASLFLKAPTEEALAHIQEAGADTTEVFLSTFSEYKPQYAELLKSRLGGLSVNSLHILNTQLEPQFFNSYERVRADAYQTLEEILQSANLLGAKYYTFRCLIPLNRCRRRTSCW